MVINCVIKMSDTEKNDVNETIEEKLKDMPDVLELVINLKKTVKKQEKTIRKLKSKLKKRNKMQNKSTQTDQLEQDLTIEVKSITEDIKEAATAAMESTGFVYEETSGLYYDYKTGYYYNAEYGLYYDGNTGTYMTYNQEKKIYEFHSQVDLNEENAENKRKINPEIEQETKRRRRDVKKKLLHDSNEELEEGECSDSGSEILEKNVIVDNNDSVTVDECNIPCVRIIVEETNVPSLKVGSLYIITIEGGTIGREGDHHSIIIKDINVSKHHLKIDYRKDTKTYAVTDLGSRNGTFLNGKRMSTSKCESEPIEIVHGSKITLGATILLCHVHVSNQTCGHCEPGLIQRLEEDDENKCDDDLSYDKTKRHKNEMKKLRKKFGLCNSNWDNKLKIGGAGYVDRAQVRRETVGSLNHNEKTEVASVNASIASTNKGFKLLAKMGWSEGQSLGKNSTGLLEPINQVSNVGTSGLGLEKTTESNSVDQLSKFKKENWSKAQERYKKIVTSELTQKDDDDDDTD